MEHAHAPRPQRPLDLPNELPRVQRVVEHVRELEIEGLFPERLRVEVALHDEGRPRHQIDPDRVVDADLPQGGDLLADPGPDRERLGGIREEAPPLQALEELGEHEDLAIPIPGGPDVLELRVQGLVELVLDVGIVGRVAAPDTEVAGRGGGGGGRW